MNHEVKSAVRALEILEFLGAAVEPVSLKDIAVTLGYPKSSAHALTQTLVGRGYLLQEGERYVIADDIRAGFTAQSRHARLVPAVTSGSIP
jgi:DNA-binding IclR family transcriptional regulator